MHTCIICDIDIYHDKLFIENHLAIHNLSLKKYRDREKYHTKKKLASSTTTMRTVSRTGGEGSLESLDSLDMEDMMKVNYLD